MTKQGSTLEDDKNHLFDLYDNIARDAYQLRLESDLSSFIECQRLHDEIVQKGKQKIDAQFYDRKKLIDSKGRIHRSSLINKYHMMKAELRHKMCQQIFGSVFLRITQILEQNQQQHCLILIKLIVQGSLRMFEPELHIRCLPKHIPIIERVLQSSQYTFNSVMKQETGRHYPIKLHINQLNTLKERDISGYGHGHDEHQGHGQGHANDAKGHGQGHGHEHRHDKQIGKKKEDGECIGGVILADPTGNIIYNNTIDARINILREICMPMIRLVLWPNMKQSIQNGKVL